jgi:hypothetical protein
VFINYRVSSVQVSLSTLGEQTAKTGTDCHQAERSSFLWRFCAQKIDTEKGSITFSRFALEIHLWLWWDEATLSVPRTSPSYVVPVAAPLSKAIIDQAPEPRK